MREFPMIKIRRPLACLASLILVAAFSTAAFAQGRANLRGLITDEFGAAIVGATVNLTDASGAKKTATTNADGTYSFTGLTPGKYKVSAIAVGCATSEDAEVDVSAGRRDPFNISLKIATIESQVKINAETPLSTDSSANANQTVISGRDLDALPDDPTELAAALQALAGPSIGPNGGQIFIDGFSGGNMPPKESIREIRINQNPFAAENDQPSARIEILTRPGSDKLRGSASKNSGVNGFSLPERAFDSSFTSHVFQVTETAVLNATTINETRFQFSHNRSEQLGNSTIPILNVSGAFVGGGSQIGHATNTTTRWELQNFTQIQKGMHTIKFGGRIRDVNIRDISPNNFGGQWIFTGGTSGLTSIQRYQRTLQLMQQGQSAAQIRAAGGGAAQFSISTGNPLATVSQFDIEPYVQDDWRYKPNLTFSFGLRYEIQSNAGSRLDFAPRFAVAWSPGAANATKPPKTVIRAGAGIFYNRFNEGSTLTANRLNGINVQQFTFAESTNPLVPTDPATLTLLNSYHCADGSFRPDCVSSVPSIVGASPLQQSIWRVQTDLRIPTVYVAGAQVERQLPHNFTVSVGAYAIRILHAIRARDVNAPIPGTITAANPGGIRPNPGGEIDQFEATGRFHQEQMFVGFNSRLNPQFSVSGNYVLSKTMNDTDGQGSSSLFPANSYDASGEWGRGLGDVRHRFFLFGTYNNPKLWKLTFSPFVTASSAPPFNITTGIDSNLDRVFADRPSFAGANANCASPFIRCTPFGNFNLLPVAGETIIPRNYGRAK